MKKLKKIGVQTIQTLLMCLILSLVCEGCNAKVFQKKKSMYESIDSVMRAEIGDSLTGIMLGATNIIADRVVASNDSVTVLSSHKLNKEEKTLTKFLLATQEEFGKVGIIFGMPAPSLRLTFIRKKSAVSAEYDFGKHLVILKGADGKEVTRYQTTDNLFLKLAMTFFPNDDFLTLLLKQNG